MNKQKIGEKKMQDRFKYRAYHKPTKTLFDVYGFNEDFIFADTLDGIGTQFNPVRTNECELIQCTGLKDKNGKLIYEGDLLRYPAKDSYSERIFMFCEVFWHDNDCCDNHVGWQIDRHHSKGGLMECNFGAKYKFIPKNTEKMEIIGNIYENPELLEVQNELKSI